MWTRVHFVGPEPPLLVRDDFKAVQTALDAQQSVPVTRAEEANTAVIYRNAVAFIEDAPPGVVTAVNPDGGFPGDVFQITGLGFTGATDVTFGGASASSISVVSDSEMTAVVPFGPYGPVDLVVVVPTGTIPAGIFGCQD